MRTTHLTELYEAAQKATPGPWKWRTDQNGQGYETTRLVGSAAGCTVIDSVGWHGDSDVVIEDVDAAFIAAADPDTVMALIEVYHEAKKAMGNNLAVDLRAAIEKVEALPPSVSAAEGGAVR